MTDQVIVMSNGTRWKPSTASDIVHCISCDNAVDTPAEIASYPDGHCPDCGNSWTGSEKRSTVIQVTGPEQLYGGAG